MAVAHSEGIMEAPSVQVIVVGLSTYQISDMTDKQSGNACKGAEAGGTCTLPVGLHPPSTATLVQ
jgi:hypothetical protein